VAATSHAAEPHDHSWEVRDHRSSDACSTRQMTEVPLQSTSTDLPLGEDYATAAIQGVRR
jgi:hypothetical protein